MSATWDVIWHLPVPARQAGGDSRLPKTTLVTGAGLNKSEQKLLDKLQGLCLWAVVRQDTAGIAPRCDELRDMRSLIFLRCAFKAAPSAPLLHLLHRCFPNPTVLMWGEPVQGGLSACLTRKNLAKPGSSVLEEVQGTGKINLLSPEYADFRTSLAWDNLPQEDICLYLEDLLWRLRLSHALPALGFFPLGPAEEREELAQYLGQLEKLDASIRELEKQRKVQDMVFREKARLRMALHELCSKRQYLTEHIALKFSK